MENFKEEFRNRKMLFSKEKIGLLVVSGDVVDKGTNAYGSAKEFINIIQADDTQLPILIVPGNHDRIADQDKSPFSPFADFLRKLKIVRDEHENLRSYAFAKSGQHYDIKALDKGNIIVLGLNSSHFSSHEAGFDENSVDNALKDARIGEAELKIAVWHHEPRFSSEPDSNVGGVLKKLRNHGFQVLLHGHYHIAKYPMTVAILDSVGRWYTIPAGTFGEDDLKTMDYSPSYNIIRIHERTRSFRITVQVRNYDRIGKKWDTVRFHDQHLPPAESVEDDVDAGYYEWQIWKSQALSSRLPRKELRKNFDDAILKGQNTFNSIVSEVTEWFTEDPKTEGNQDDRRVVLVIGPDINCNGLMMLDTSRGRLQCH
jgi:DNA repair exonuclease SbcCD nuclease subunit